MFKFITLVAALTLPFAAQAQTLNTNSPAAKLCVKKVSKQMKVAQSDVAIYDILESEAATVVFVTVGSKSGAWKCFVTPQGKFDGIEVAE